MNGYTCYLCICNVLLSCVCNCLFVEEEREIVQARPIAVHYIERKWDDIYKHMIEENIIEEGEQIEITPEIIARFHGVSVEDVSILGENLELPDMPHTHFDQPEEVEIPEESVNVEKAETSFAAEPSSPSVETNVDFTETVDDLRFDDSSDQEDSDLEMNELPEMTEILKKNIEELNRKFREKIAAEAAQKAQETGDTDFEEGQLPEEDQFPADEFERVYISAAERKGWFRDTPPVHVPSYVESFQSHYRKSKGKIIAWGWFHTLKAFIVKRERGVEYYESCKTLATLPYFDWMAMAKLKMLNPNKVPFADIFEQRLRWGYNVSWKKEKLKPGQKDFVHIPQFASKFDTFWNKKTGWVKTAVYKKSKKLGRNPIRKMRQDIHSLFIDWYYDGRTHEAVIILRTDQTDRNGKVEEERIFDPYWIRNMNKRDIECLLRKKIHAMPYLQTYADIYDRTAKLCYVEGLHA